MSKPPLRPLKADPRSAEDGDMSAEHLLAELEQLIKNAKPVPLTDQVRIRSDEALALIERIREALAGR